MNARIHKFEQIIQSLCLSHGIKFLPMYDEWKAIPDYKNLFIDGLHPNTEGHKLMAEQIKPFILTNEFLILNNKA